MTLESVANLFAYSTFVVVMGTGLAHQLVMLGSGRRPTTPEAARRLRIEVQQPDGTIMMGVLGVAIVVAGLIRLGQGEGRPHWYFILAVPPLVVAIGLRVTGSVLLRRLRPVGGLGLDPAVRRREPRRIVTGVLTFGCLFGAWVVEQAAGEPTGWALLLVFVMVIPGTVFCLDTFRFMASIRPRPDHPVHPSP